MSIKRCRGIVIGCVSALCLFTRPMLAFERFGGSLDFSTVEVQRVASTSGSTGGGIAAVLARFDTATRQKIIFCVMREQGCSACGAPAYYGDNVHFNCNTAAGLMGAIQRCAPVCGLGR